jgi:periplasmic divalent cation tolerance protein
MSRVVVLVTCPAGRSASRIARSLVEEKLAACVNIVPRVASVFAWKGKVERASESLLVIKTRRSLFDRLSRRVRELHSYAVPEVIAVPVTEGLRDYLRWLDGETRP